MIIPDLALDRCRTDTDLDRPPLIVLARVLGNTLLGWNPWWYLDVAYL